MKIPFSRPYITGKEIENIKNLINNIKNGWIISGDGHYTKLVSRFIEEKFSVKRMLMTTSCTSALEIATRLIDLKHGDEVIVPSFTFVSTVNPILIYGNGAKPVFTDIREDNGLNIDPEDIRRKVTPKTKAIYIVHYAGVACDMEEIMDISDEYNLKVVEDAAHGVNALYDGYLYCGHDTKYLGTIGDLGCYSFHDTKNYTCGEGGVLLINSDDHEIWERAEIIREKGTNRSKFFRGEIDKYGWVDIGSSYLPSDILAAFLYAQLEKLDEIQEKRFRIYDKYNEVLEEFGNGKIKLPIVPEYAEHNAHLYHILLNNETDRDRIMKELKKLGIHTTFHYLPLHTSPMGLKMGYKYGDLPVTENVSERLLRLPLYPGMTDNELEYVIYNLRKVILSL